MTDQTFCAVAEDGFHCGHEIHRHVKHLKTLTARCCWCDALAEITFSVVRIAFPDHGMGYAHETEVWDLPAGWRKGDD